MREQKEKEKKKKKMKWEFYGNMLKRAKQATGIKIKCVCVCAGWPHINSPEKTAIDKPSA